MEDMGLNADCLRLRESDRRLLETVEWEERPENAEAAGEEERGVDISELGVLYALNAI